ncbi:MAG: permease-like cell division protein FtsX [Candidatus Uhrbacteria bacterium]
MIKWALQDFGRNVWLSVTTVLILTLTLVSVQVLLAVNVAGGIALDELESRVDLRVQFLPTVSESDVDALRSELLQREETTRVEHISSEQVFREFSILHEGNNEILSALEELGENPFGPEIRVHVRNPADFAIIEEIIAQPGIAERVTETGSGDRSLLVERLTILTRKLRAAGLIMSGLSFLVTLLIIINAMRIVTYVRRDEVGIMKLVGATNWFVRMPFLIMGVLASAVATIIVQVVTFPVLDALEPTFYQFLGERSMDIGLFFRYHIVAIAGGEFLGLAVLTVLISAIALRRYLRV